MTNILSLAVSDQGHRNNGGTGGRAPPNNLHKYAPPPPKKKLKKNYRSVILKKNMCAPQSVIASYGPADSKQPFVYKTCLCHVYFAYTMQLCKTY